MCLCCFSNTCLRKDKLLDRGLHFTNDNKMAVCLRKVDALIVLLSLLHAVKSEEKLISEVLKEPPSDCSRYASLPFRYIFAWVNLSCKIYLVFFYKHSIVFLKPPLRRRLCNVLQPFFWLCLVQLGFQILIWNFQWYWRNSKWTFQEGLIKNNVEFPGVIKKKSAGISRGLDFRP